MQDRPLLVTDPFQSKKEAEDLITKIEVSSTDHPPAEEGGVGFRTDEHIHIGDKAFAQFLIELQENHEEVFEEVKSLLDITEDDYEKIKLPLTDKLSLTAGEIVALAGDYFGDGKDAISFGIGESGKEGIFLKAYMSLIDPQHADQINDILAYTIDQTNLYQLSAKKEHEKLGFKREKTPDGSWAAHFKLTRMTQKSLFCHSRYNDLTLANFDHFGNEAKEAFRVGLARAMKTAKLAAKYKRQGDGEKCRSHFREAIGNILFACHFLTDLYASGHIRTPRKEILNTILGKPIHEGITDVRNISPIELLAAGFFAHRMHDKDGEDGLYVKSNYPTAKKWEAFGDGNFFNDKNEDNAKAAYQAVVIALNDVLAAYQDITYADKFEAFFQEKYLQLIPVEDSLKNEDERLPLFRVKDDKVEVQYQGRYEPMQPVPDFFRFFSLDVKNAAGEKIRVTAENAKDFLQKNTEQVTKCSIM